MEPEPNLEVPAVFDLGEGVIAGAKHDAHVIIEYAVVPHPLHACENRVWADLRPLSFLPSAAANRLLLSALTPAIEWPMIPLLRSECALHRITAGRRAKLRDGLRQVFLPVWAKAQPCVPRSK